MQSSASDWYDEAMRRILTGTVHDEDFVAFRNYSWFSQHVQLILDVGANRGQSLCSFSAVLPGKKIHCFEANPVFFSLLDRLRGEVKNSTIHHFGLGRQEEKLSFYIPHAGNEEYLEEASTRLDYYDKPWVKEKFLNRGGMRLETITAQIKAGDSLGLQPNLIKIDVEGAELDVLAGFDETIARCHPVFLIENSDYVNVTEFLAHRGYLPIQYDATKGELTRDIREMTNTFYFHWESADQILGTKEPADALRLMSAQPAIMDCAKFDLGKGDDIQEMSPGGVQRFEVRVKNGSSVSVSSMGQGNGKFAVFVSYHWLTETGEMFIWDNIRSPLPGEIKPGQEARVPLDVAAPSNPGTYILEVDVVQEGVTWFKDKGMRSLQFKISVR